MPLEPRAYHLPDMPVPGRRALLLGFVGLVLCGVGMALDAPRFLQAYLTAYVFWVSIGLGALFFVMLHHLIGSQWSIVLRRITETVMFSLPLMAVFFIPIAFGLPLLYRWGDPEAVAADHILQHRSVYLNAAFFIARTLLYFIIWFLLSYRLYKWSLDEDSGYDEARRARMRRLSAVGMVLFAFTVSFAAFDWLMSLDAHWYSTIFGAYVFAGSVMAALCFLTLSVMALKRRGLLADIVTVEHYHDLGKLIFAFTIFWAYMAFSQYMLIWYANIPEETVWFAERWTGSWKTVSLLLVFGHFVIPFVLLMPKMMKRRPSFLMAIGLWLLVIHWVDLFWLVLPSLQHEGAVLSWMDPVAMLGIGGVFCGLFWRRLARHPLVPLGDPRLDASSRSDSH
ncbi:MAG: hypothetical protein AB1792_08880 [Candidatus Zixiibacteriota bacterium]